MKKTIVIMLALVVSAMASDPRLTVLGGDARLLIDDYNELYAYPGTISDYQYVTGGSESENVTDGWFGLVKHFGGTTIGGAINHNQDALEIIYHPGAWGLVAAFDYDKEHDEAADSTASDMSLSLTWGREVQLFGDYSDFSIGGGYDSQSIEVGSDDASQSNIMLAASVRGHSDAFMNLFPIISVGFDSESQDVNDVDGSITTIYGDLGAGHNKLVAPKTNVVAGAFVGFQSVSYGGDAYEDVDSELDVMIPRITGGVEQQIGKWLVFRAGATSITEYESQGDNNSMHTSFNTNFGLGLKWDNFILDATIGEDFLHDGPYMVGGNSNGFVGSVAATYSF